MTAPQTVFEITSNYNLRVNNVSVSEQYGFRKGLSTENATHTLIDGILKAWYNKMHVSWIFCDLAKAFVCVNHKILLIKLQHHSVQDVNINWIKSWLYNRKQKVKLKINNVQDNSPSSENVKCGVTQGSVLDPSFITADIYDFYH